MPSAIATVVVLTPGRNATARTPRLAASRVLAASRGLSAWLRDHSQAEPFASPVAMVFPLAANATLVTPLLAGSDRTATSRTVCIVQTYV